MGEREYFSHEYSDVSGARESVHVAVKGLLKREDNFGSYDLKSIYLTVQTHLLCPAVSRCRRWPLPMCF